MNTERHGFTLRARTLPHCLRLSVVVCGARWPGIFLYGWAAIIPLSRASEVDVAWRKPPPAARPWVMWSWIKGAVSREGITADLEAGFVVIGGEEGVEPFVAAAARAMTGPWDVIWTDPIDGGETHRRLVTLRDWRELEEVAGLSGTASYQTTFEVSEQPAHAFLSLGEVHNLARVFVNGVDCGVAWTRPYRVDISSALRVGENSLNVRITNNRANRLRAEQTKPEGDRKAWSLVPAPQIIADPQPAGRCEQSMGVGGGFACCSM